MLSSETLKALFAAIDAQDGVQFASFITPRGRFIYGAQMDVTGTEAIAQAVNGFFSMLAGLSHSNLRSWMGDDGRTQFVSGDVHYILPNGNTCDVSFLNQFTVEGDKIADYRVFTDPTPLFKAMG